MNFLSYFQQWSLNKDITFPNSPIKSKSGIIGLAVLGYVYFQVSPDSWKKIEDWDFVYPRLHFNFFSSLL